jgi:hypothetical protein
MTTYFGDAWDVPMLDGATPVRTPVLWPCYWCGRLIMPGESGFMIPRITEDAAGTLAAEPSYIHRECQFAATLGPLVGVFDYAAYHSMRDAAVLAWRRWELVRDDPPW